MTELWLVDLDATGPVLAALERQEPRLTAADRARARRPSEARERRRRQAAYMALRIVLERIAGPAVRGQRIVRPPGGRPRLAGSGPHFSLSHAGGWALIGVAPAHVIGVDLETSRALSMSPRRREEVLAVGMGLAARPLAGGHGEAALLQAWCRLEACAKARGSGVAALLAALGLRASGGRQLPLAQIEAAARQLARNDGLAVRDVELPAGLLGATASAGGPAPVRPRRFPRDRRAIVRLLAGGG
jgi:4'-phosphopantetheinyl transferase